MNSTMREVLDFVCENDVKFIRLGFCDPSGIQKNVSIMPERLLSAFEHGVPFDASAIKGFRGIKKSELLLFPDPTTLSVLPWRPGPGRVVRFYCDLRRPDGSVYLNDGRNILKKAVNEAFDMGISCKMGADCEFYLFKTDEEGEPTYKTIDKGSYLDITPIDKGENIRREICLCLEEMGITPEASQHEQGPGQNKIDFEYGEPLECADNIMTFKSVVKAMAARNGLFASFMPKPLADEAGNSMHINILLESAGKNLLASKNEEDRKIVESFIAGILEKIQELTLFLNPTINSYERFGSHDAPQYVSWSLQNRSQLIRIPTDTSNRQTFEIRSPDPSVNPYTACAVLIYAGLYGVKNKLVLPPMVNEDLFSAQDEIVSKLKKLPQNMREAIEFAKTSELAKELMGESSFNSFIAMKEFELEEYEKSENKLKFYHERYFNMI